MISARHHFILLCILTLFFCCDCKANKTEPSGPGIFNFNKDLDFARGVVSRYLDSLRDKDYRRAAEYCSPEFFKTINKEKFKEQLAETAKELGAVKGYKELSHTGKKRNKKDSKQYFVLRYEVVYERATGEETFILDPAPGSGVYEITEWHRNVAQKIK